MVLYLRKRKIERPGYPLHILQPCPTGSGEYQGARIFHTAANGWFPEPGLHGPDIAGPGKA